MVKKSSKRNDDIKNKENRKWQLTLSFFYILKK